MGVLYCGANKGKHPNWVVTCGGSSWEVLLNASLPVVVDGSVQDHLVLEWTLLSLVIL